MSKKHQVTLLRDHTHAGQPCRAGETISVDDADRAWLQAQQIIAAKPAAAAADQPSTGGDK